MLSVQASGFAQGPRCCLFLFSPKPSAAGGQTPNSPTKPTPNPLLHGRAVLFLSGLRGDHPCCAPPQADAGPSAGGERTTTLPAWRPCGRRASPGPRATENLTQYVERSQDPPNSNGPRAPFLPLDGPRMQRTIASEIAAFSNTSVLEKKKTNRTQFPSSRSQPSLGEEHLLLLLLRIL